MARAVRAVVLAAENFRLRAARSVLGVGPTEMIALFHLFAEGTSTPTELADRLQITTASVTELVERLGRAGLARAARRTPTIGARSCSRSPTSAHAAGRRDVRAHRGEHGPVHEPALGGRARGPCCGSCTILALAYSATSPTPETGGPVLNP